MTTVGIIGSGQIGGTVARLSVAAGHAVVLSNSRGPETLAELAAELGPRATPATAEQAADAGDLVLVSYLTLRPRAAGQTAAGREAGPAEITAIGEIEAIGESLGELVIPDELMITARANDTE